MIIHTFRSLGERDSTYTKDVIPVTLGGFWAWPVFFSLEIIVYRPLDKRSYRTPIIPHVVQNHLLNTQFQGDFILVTFLSPYIFSCVILI